MDLSSFDAALEASKPQKKPAAPPPSAGGFDFSSFEAALGKQVESAARPPSRPANDALDRKAREEIFSIGGAAAAVGKRLVSFTVGNAAAIVDMIVGAPTDLAAIGVEANRRRDMEFDPLNPRPKEGARTLRRETDASIAADAAKRKADFRAKFGEPLKKVLGVLGVQDIYDTSEVARALQFVGAKLEEGGDSLEKATGGKLKKEDALALFDQTLAAAGVAGTPAALRATSRAAPRVTRGLEPRANFPVDGKMAQAMLPPVPALPAGLNEALSKPVEMRLGRRVVSDEDLRKAEAELSADAFREEIAGIPPALRTGEGSRSVRDPRRSAVVESGIMGLPTPEAPRIDPALGLGETAPGGRNVQRASAVRFDELGRPIAPEGPAAPRINPALSLGEGARSVADPKRAVGDSGLEGVKPAQRKQMLYGLAAGGAAAAFAATYGEYDNEAAASLAAAGALLAGRGRGMTLDVVRAMPDATPLGAILDRSQYTLSSLEMLPKNRFEFSKQQVEQLLKRQEVTKAERDVLTQALAAAPGETITAKQLMQGVKEATGDFELKQVETDDFADYGLSSIGRADKFDGAFDEVRSSEVFDTAEARLSFDGRLWEIYDADGDYITNLMRDNTLPDEAAAVARARAENQKLIEGPATATTTIYQSPVELGVGNHFGDPNYFAHSRSFVEGGVRHVVELQSDLAQKAGKELTEVEKQTLVDQFHWGAEVAQVWEGVRYTSGRAGDYDFFKGLERFKRSEELVARALGHRDQTVKLEAKLFNNMSAAGPEASRLADAFAREKIKDFTPEMMQDYERGFVDVSEGFIDWLLERRMELPAGDQEVMRGVLNRYATEQSAQFGARSLEAQTKLQGAMADPVRPMLKDWYKRLIREEVARAAQGEVNPAYAKLQKQIELSTQGVVNNKDYPEIARALQEEVDALTAQLAQVPERLPPPAAVRFATADTVAKVEGWPRQTELLDRLTETRRRFEERGNNAGLASTEEEFRRLQTSGGGLLPEHQGIYDRYQKDVTKFLRQLGGKEVTDDRGVTWIEVPLEPKKGGTPLTRTQMFGVGAVAAGAGLLSLLTEDEQSAAAPIAAMALFAQSRSPGVRAAARGTIEAAESVLGNLSTSIRNISEAMLRPVRKHELDLLKHTYDRLKTTTPFVERLKSLPRDKREAISAALFSGKPGEVIPLIKSLDPALLPELAKVRRVLSDLGNGLVEVGKLKGLRPEYFPRIVADYEGLLKYLGSEGGASALEKRLFLAERNALKKTGEAISSLDRSAIIADWLSQQMRGQGKAGFLKNRSVEQVTREMLPFYAPADEALILYTRAATIEIERAKFFGKHLVRDPETNKVNLDASIHNIVEEKLRNKEVTFEQLQRLKDLLWTRFGPGERGMSGLVENAKNLGYAALLAQPTAALVQLGDVATVVYAHGLLPTIKAVGQTLSGRGRITTADFGLIDNISAETASVTGTARFVNKVFKLSGFNLVDRFGKGTAINGALNKYSSLAKSERGIETIKKKYGEYFGDDLGKLVSDLRAGTRTPLVDELIFSELSDLQPVSRVEMPRKYLEMQNGRALYMLKSFMLKQADIVRRDVWNEWKRGNRLAATNKALRFGLALGIGGASTEFVRNWLLGRDDELEWTDVPANVFKTFMLSEYVLDQPTFAKKVEAAGKSVLPPLGITTDILSTGELAIDWLQGEAEIEDGNAKAIRYIPIVGAALYNDALPLQRDFGLEFGGAERSNRLREQRERQKERRELMGE